MSPCDALPKPGDNGMGFPRGGSGMGVSHQELGKALLSNPPEPGAADVSGLPWPWWVRDGGRMSRGGLFLCTRTQSHTCGQS